MPTQPGGYRTADGKRVPSVTTITSRFHESGGLIHWASRLALEPLMEARALAKQPEVCATYLTDSDPDLWDYKLARDKAADAGTIAHEMVECFIRRTEFDAAKYSPDLLDMASPAFWAFREWASQSQLEIVETEKPLVSEKYRFGGTRDGIMISGKRAIYDLKTSRDVYPEYLLQLAAYGILDEEHGNTIDGGYHLLKISKQERPEDPIKFQHMFWNHLEPAKRCFLILREAYDLMAQLKGIAK